MPIPLNHVGAGVVTLAAPTSGNVTLTLPVADGTNGQALTTNGSGQLAFSGVTTAQAGSAAAPSITTTGDTNTGIFFPAADTIAFAEGGAEVARFDSGGRLLVGRTSSSGSAYSLELSNGTSDNRIGMYSDSTLTGGLLCTTNELRMLGLGASTALTFQTNGSERARIDSSGNVGIGTSTPTGFGSPNFHINGSTPLIHLTTPTSGAASGDGTQIAVSGLDFQITNLEAGNILFGTSGAERARFTPNGDFFIGTTNDTYAYAGNSMRWYGSALAGLMLSAPTTSAVNQVSFWNPNGQVGQINSQNSGTIYGTSSDYRLKHDIAPMTGALAKVALLKPCTYKWNVDGSDGQGFIAHELQEVCPDAVTGAKDAVDAEGNPLYQGFDASFLVATLTAALQEAHGLITALTARVEALESN
jgi:hypothetical protein